MDIDRERLRASHSDALAAKAAFMSTFKHDLSRCAVGLGVSDDGTDWMLKVYVQDPEVEPHLPDHFGHFAVAVETIGPVTAFGP